MSTARRVPAVRGSALTGSDTTCLDDHLLNVREAAAFLGLEVGTLYRWVQLRKIPVVRFGRTVRFRLRSLKDFVAQHEEGGGS